jgi:hypothetical protein
MGCEQRDGAFRLSHTSANPDSPARSENQRMAENEPDSKAIVVLTREEIDTLIHGVEEAGVGLDDDEFTERYGDVYQKLHAIDDNGENEYRVK